MHMSDALVSPPVAGAVGVISIALLAVAISKTRKSKRENIVPLMGVMGAFVFAAQMLNFTIPGTGSSGHIVGGILLASVLGPWAAFITLTSVLVLQALLFADGGLLVLGCNIVNMAAFACLVAYPLIFRPLMRGGTSSWLTMSVSVLACVVGLELGAAAVTFETELSGITALPTRQFLGFMLPIHFLIGIGEGLATGAVICFISRRKPSLLEYSPSFNGNGKTGKAIGVIAASALVIAAVFSVVASSRPDGLEWSIIKLTGSESIDSSGTAHEVAGNVQNSTALIPDYGSSAAGIVGSGIIMLSAIGITYMVRHKRA